MSKNIKIAVRKFDPFEKALEKQWEAYCETTGCTMGLEAVPMDLQPLYNATLGKENGLENGDWDMAHITTDWITEAKESKKVMPLNNFLDKNPPEDYPNGWSQSLLKTQNFDGQIYGLPFHDGPECLIYRKDLFDDFDEKKAFKKKHGRPLAPPNTWTELLETSRFFQRPKEGLYGTAIAAFPDSHNTVFDLALQIWARGGVIIDDRGKININTQAAADGLTFYSQLLKDTKAIHPKSAEMDSVKLGMAFANGEVAMMVNWFGFASLCEVMETSKVKGKVDVVQIPGSTSNAQGTSLNAYWMYTIGAGCKNKEIAYDFIRFAVNPENDKLLTLEGGIGCRKSTWFDAEVNSSVPYYHKLEELHQHCRTLPRKSNWAQIGSFMDKVVTEAITSSRPSSEILMIGQEKISALEEKFK